MKNWINYKILVYLLLTLPFLTSCEKDLIDIDELPIAETLPPISQYKTSIKNNEFNTGRYDNLSQYTQMGQGTSTIMFRRGFSYFDWESDMDYDVFVNIQKDEHNNISQWTEYGVLKNNGSVNGITQWIFDKSMILEQLPYYASKISTTDINGDGYTDFVIFVADDAFEYGGNIGESSGGIFSYVYNDGMYELNEIVPYQSGGNQMYYHGGSLADINGDGYPDIVAGTAELKVWLNNGSGNFTYSHAWFDVGSFICSETLFDINKDGYMDLIVGEAKSYDNPGYSNFYNDDNYNESTIIFLGTDSYPFYNDEPDIILEPQYDYVGESNWLQKSYTCTFDIAITDWDNDGDYDIFTSTYRGVTGDEGTLISYYENNNNNVFDLKTEEVFNEGEWFMEDECRSGYIKAYDWDGDGKKELMAESSTCRTFNTWIQVNGKLSKNLIQY